MGDGIVNTLSPDLTKAHAGLGIVILKNILHLVILKIMQLDKEKF